jgi:WD40 repeat protein
MADVGGGTESLSATHAATYELLQRLRAAKERESVASTASSSSSGSVNAQLKFAKLAKTTKPKTRRLLRGHSSRVTDLKWGEGDTLVSCARDGLMHLWHGPSARVAHTWQTPGSWAMTCCLDGGVAAVGGLDNMVSVYLVPDEPDSGALDHVAPNSVRAGGDATAIVGHRRRGTIGFDGVASSSDRQFTASAQMPEPDVRRPDITLEGHGG